MNGRSLRAVGWARSLPLNSQVTTARDWARAHLDELGWTSRHPDTADDVLLVVSELVTNAHVHGHSTAQLVMSWDSQCLHIAPSARPAVAASWWWPRPANLSGL